ncbi:4-hydroxyphenylacetate degradation bifunctional isomerase/decarboxylase subunit HpaG1 [Fictibacillus macauensis ZFHKF-1]|uniref:4-hydroxyphenylacetate degradation bifunctional isomerase/decarboxylase subunit HpaG1 n=1 Tax=Fictibacillus macauensis ZFHKF-1 TaxID=1196324 RepID=I8AFC7_9BACL|nr:fumarylacetoacetate hydrolase family protein [Fictibacillus macauensis]EIT84337.1 4-hydroxyphenylacetate degradation bifunctional isomerase/decarboxylase subunit HpaG1 [Fictibacillus macauensis ZFHKF-1]
MVQVKVKGQQQMLSGMLHEEGITIHGETKTLQELEVEAPLVNTIYGVALNYKGVLAALGEAMHEAPYKAPPKAPVLYIKPRNTINSHRCPIEMPASVTELEMGATLGVIIGKRATHVPQQEALHYVAGYTIVNDVSIPHDSVYRPAVAQKARDGFCAIGPWMVEAAALPNVEDVTIAVSINGERRMETNTSQLVRSIPALIADITEFMTLEAGDLLLVGIPENAPRAVVGDAVCIDIAGIGSLENHIVPQKIGGDAR